MTNDDKELLRLAAKAGGYEIEWYASSNEAVVGAGGFYRNEGVRSIPWNSFSNDADAFKLLTKLQLRFESTDDYMVCYAGTVMAAQFTERVINGNRDAAARRAITRAAAHIGSKLP